MSEGPRYTSHHPRWLRPRMSTFWWLGRRSHLAFILRELTSVFVAWFVVYLLILVRAVIGGPDAYRGFLEWSAGPLVLPLNVASLVFIVYHAVTWFNLAPKAMVVRVGGRRVPDPLVAMSNYLAWVVASAAIAWLLVGG